MKQFLIIQPPNLVLHLTSFVDLSIWYETYSFQQQKKFSLKEYERFIAKAKISEGNGLVFCNKIATVGVKHTLNGWIILLKLKAARIKI